VTHGFPNTNKFLEGLKVYPLARKNFHAKDPHVIWQLINAGQLIASKQIPDTEASLFSSCEWIRYASGFLLFSSAAYFFALAVRRVGRERTGYWIIFTWWLVPLINFFNIPGYRWYYYLLPWFPAVFVVLAIFFDFIFRRLRAVGILFFLCLMMFNLFAYGSFLEWLSGNGYVYRYGQTLGNKKQVVKTICDYAKGKPFNLILATPGLSQAAPYVALFEGYFKTRPASIFLLTQNKQTQEPIENRIYPGKNFVPLYGKNIFIIQEPGTNTLPEEWNESTLLKRFGRTNIYLGKKRVIVHPPKPDDVAATKAAPVCPAPVSKKENSEKIKI
jgi:hypothetical protein